MITYIDPKGVRHEIGVEYRTILNQRAEMAAVDLFVFRVQFEDGEVVARDALTIVDGEIRWCRADPGMEAPSLARIPDEALARAGTEVGAQSLDGFAEIGSAFPPAAVWSSVRS